MKVYRPIFDCECSPKAYKSKKKAIQILLDYYKDQLIEHDNEIIIASHAECWIDVFEVE